MNSLDDIGMDAFCEGMAKSLSEDPDQQILIKDGLKNFYLQRASGLPQMSLNETTQRRFYVDRSLNGTTVLWDFYTLAVYMANVRFTAEGAWVANFRSGDDSFMPAPVAHGFAAYLRETIPWIAEQLNNEETK